MAVVGVYDAPVSHRPYKPILTHEVSMEAIPKDAGTHFDPVLGELSKGVIGQFEWIAGQYSDKPFSSSPARAGGRTPRKG